MQLTTSSSATASGATAAALFDRVADPAAAADFFRGFGPVPGITAVKILGNGPLASGSRREIVLADGSTLLEEVLAFDRPHQHRYCVVEFGPPLSRLVKAGTGTWTFDETTSGATVCWSYCYEVKSLWVLPVAIFFVKVLMKGAMRRAVQRLSRSSEVRRASLPNRGSVSQEKQG